MNRRHFLRSAGALGFATMAPTLLRQPGLIGSANAAPLVDSVNYVTPARLPQVVNVFLYGGPSELAGNLTNIDVINANSQNAYPADLLMPVADGGQITPNGFWANAGGLAMEEMLQNGDMSVYRTIYRRKDDTKAHRPSVFSSQKGSLDIEGAPGVGSTLAQVLYANRGLLDGSAALGGRQLTDLVLPFISFEGTTTAFAPSPDSRMPLQFKGLSLDESFDNPYSRGRDDHDAELRALVNNVVGEAQRTRFAKVAEGFDMRRRMESLIGNLQNAAESPLPAVGANDVDADPDTGRLRYPQNNRFSGRIKAAVTLAINNPDSLFITVGGGLGGWDDHNDAVDEYAPRMAQLMASLRVAMKHIRLSHSAARRTDNIIINVHGDFGRNVNLNNSGGWDHGNNQNLYTFGGAGVRGASALGKIVGKTQLYGPPRENRQFTVPTDDSYSAEPMAIASTVYQWFGVQNPEVLTQDAVLNPSGDAAINEKLNGIGVVRS